MITLSTDLLISFRITLVPSSLLFDDFQLRTEIPEESIYSTSFKFI